MYGKTDYTVNTWRDELCVREIHPLLENHKPMNGGVIPIFCLTMERKLASTNLCISTGHHSLCWI